MLRRLIHNLAKPRHPWRRLEFNELSEIYASMSIRSFGFGIIGIFVPIYLYQNGSSLQSIFMFYTLFFIFRLPIAYVSAYVVGRIGPKHSIAISTLLLVVFLSQLLTLDMFEWPLALLAFSFSVTNGLFFVAYNTDFSKIKDTKNGGKELSWLYIFERIGGALGPLVGGILASLIAPELTIFVAIVVLICSLIPLFMTNEPVRLNQNIKFKGFPWQVHFRDFISIGAFGIDNVASLVMWPLLIAVLIFTEDTYATLGVITGFSLAISVFSSYLLGKYVDNNKGPHLLQFGVVINSIVHLVRAFITTTFGAVLVTVFNEPNTLAYKIPLVKGYYDSADSEEGYRIVYLTINEMTSGFAKAIYCGALYFACYFADSISVLRFSFITVAFISLAILVQRFPALKKV
jgi:MFS family permease